MILAVDIGNTNVKIGLFEKGKLVHSFKMSSDVKRTSDEYVALLLQLLYHAKVEEKSVQGAVLSSVIPQLDYTFIHVIKHVFGIKPLVVGVGVKTGIAIRYEFPRELGSDRIANAVAAQAEYGGQGAVVGRLHGFYGGGNYVQPARKNVVHGVAQIAGAQIWLERRFLQT